MSWQKQTSSQEGHTHANLTTLNALSDIGGALAYNGSQIATGGSTSSPNSNLILGGSVRFKVDFITKTIAYTTWELRTSNQSFTLSSGSKSFTEMGTSTFYYVCYRSNTIELVSSAGIGSYAGYVLFGILNANVFPFSYPVNQIGVRGGVIYRRTDLSIGEWTLIGDSLTQGVSWWSNVVDQYWIPIVTNLAVSGKRMAGSTGMWLDKDTVTSTTEFVTIMGGTNDEGHIYTTGGTPTALRGDLLPVRSEFDTNTFYGAYQTLIEGLLIKNPKMRIFLMTPPRAWTNSATVLRANLKLVGDDVKAIGKLYNCPVIDMYHNMGYNEVNQATYLTDGLHWTGDGSKRVADLVCGALRQYY